MWLSSYWRIEPEERGGALAAIAALGTLFEGFLLIAPQPAHLTIGAPVEVFAVGGAGLRRSRLVPEREDRDDA